MLILCLVLLSTECSLPNMRQPNLAADTKRTLLDSFLTVDSELHSVSYVRSARRRAEKYARDLAACERSAPPEQPAIDCVMAVLLQPTSAGQHYGSPAANTVSAALVESRGSCAALAALVLSLTELQERPFEAVVLKDHVLLGDSADSDAFFELLSAGKRVGRLAMLSQPQPPGGPLRLSGAEYLPYYVDNLAARLAEAGASQRAEGLFQRALDLAPDSGRIQFNYGTFLLEFERNTDAEQHLSTAIELGWIDVDTFVNRGVARWKLGKIEAAAQDFEAALELRPDDGRAAENLRRLRQTEP